MHTNRDFAHTLELLCLANPDWRKVNDSLNVTAAAQDLGLAQSTLKRMLDGVVGQPSIPNGQVLTQFFGVDLEQLIGLRPIEGIDTEESALAVNTRKMRKLMPEMNEKEMVATIAFIETYRKQAE